MYRYKHEHQRQEICNLSKPQNIFLIYFPDITNGAQSIGGGGSYNNSNNNNHNDLDVGPYKIPTSKTYNKPIMSSNSDSSNVVGTTITITTQDPFNPDVRQFSRDEPYFDASTPKNVTALVGKSAYLNCRVRNLGNKTVSI